MALLDRFRTRSGRDVTVRYVSAAVEVLGKSPSELYDSQPALRAVVSFLADNIASIPLKCYLRESDTSRRRDTEGPLPLLLRYPNERMTAHELIRALVLDYKLYGFALWVVLPDASRPSGWRIEPLPAAWVQPIETIDGLYPKTFNVINPTTGRSVDIEAGACIMFSTPTPNAPLSAASPVEALKQVLAEQINAWSYRNQVWRNGGRVSQVIERPAGVEWSKEDRDRFAQSWRARFAGNEGVNSGGTPILEDGMRLVENHFNAHEAEWSEATRLAREDVAAVYHINPSLVWHTDAQTYASSKENARALYAETLSPDLDMISERLNAFLLPRLGVPANEYVEFDISKKLEASFEEQASVLQSAVGGPWMVRNEARAKFNLPAIEGGDELIVPLNVVEGGLASPNDTSPYGGYDAALPPAKSAKEARIKIKGEPMTPDAVDIASALRKFFKRQRKKVEPAIDRAKAKSATKADGDWPEWWDAERWDRELADDIEPLFLEQATARGRQALRDARIDADEYDEGRTVNYIRKMAEGKARAINNVTLRQLETALDGDISENAEGSTPAGVFDKAETDRADHAGLSFATAIAGFAVLEAIKQTVPAGTYRRVKTWIVTSGNPRPEHAAMNGETVDIDDTFSNGAAYPGDQVLTPEESCNCQCQVEITIWRD